MMLGQRLLILTVMAFAFSFRAYAVGPEDVTFHPEFPNIPIPQEINIEGKVTIKAPIGDADQSPIIQVFINGKGPFYFMFDTGWSSAMISQRVAQALQLPLADKTSKKVMTPSQVVEVFEHRYLIHELKVGSIIIKNYAINASSGFEDDVKQFKRRGVGKEAGLDGVIGQNTFYGLMTTIDYHNEIISFQKDSLSPEDKDVVSYGVTQSTPNIDLQIDFTKLKKQIKQNFTIDTGAYGYIKMNSCQIPEMHQFTEQQQLLSYDYLGDESPTYFAKLYGDIHVLPDYQIHDPYITFSSTNCAHKPHGLLGKKFFEDHLITIDHDDKLIKIQKRK